MKTAPTSKLEVYLDSSDFSTLSNTKTLTEDLSRILDKLKNLRDDGKVNFRFSDVHVSEVAPIKATENLAAESRAELMWQLCGSHTMIDHFRLMESEVKAETICAFSDTGQWYPSINGLLPENIDHLHRKIVNEILIETGLNRAQRRFRKKMILDKKGFKPKVAELFDSSQAERAKSLADIFPFTNVEALIVVGFLQNGKNREQAEAAFLRALTDPRWLIKKLATSPTDLEAVTGWLRSKGNSVATTFASCTAELQRLRREEDESENVLTSTIKGFADIDLRNTLLSSQSSRIQKSANSRSQFWQDSFLRVVNRLVDSIASEFNIHNNSALTQDEAFQRYPSISTLVAVMNHSWRNATELHPRQFRASDLGDAMHAIYAPYVDIFRADAFMAIPIQQATTRYGTKVVGNLRDLPAVIDAALSSG